MKGSCSISETQSAPPEHYEETTMNSSLSPTMLNSTPSHFCPRKRFFKFFLRLLFEFSAIYPNPCLAGVIPISENLSPRTSEGARQRCGAHRLLPSIAQQERSAIRETLASRTFSTLSHSLKTGGRQTPAPDAGEKSCTVSVSNLQRKLVARAPGANLLRSVIIHRRRRSCPCGKR